ncbi:hypothetical protein GEMRC1_002188 [Eukaryota sp. GEM-RC1]
MTQQTVYILSAVRTPLGCFQGALSSLSSSDLAAIAFKEAVKRSSVNPQDITEAILGNVLQAGGGQNPCRQAVLKAELPDSIACTSINKVCASGLKAVSLASASILSGDCEVVLAGGAESMSNAPYLLPKVRAGLRMGNAEVLDCMINDGLFDPSTNQHMGLNTETTAEEFNLTREAQDDYAERSYKMATEFWTNGNHEEIVPVTITVRGKLCQDENSQGLFQKDGTITPANASAIGDGAAAFVLASAEYVQKHGLTPLAKVVCCADSGRDPLRFTIAPAIACEKVLKRSVNEAFAAVVLANVELLKLPMDKVNVVGGGISLSHPLGASGAVRLVALIHALKHGEKKNRFVYIVSRRR